VCGAASHLDRKLLAGTNELLKTHQHVARFRPNTMPPTFGGRKALKINRAAKPPQKLILLPKAERGGSDAGTKGSRINFCGGFAALLIFRAFRPPNVGGIVFGLNLATCWWVFSNSFVPARSFRSRWLAAPHTPRAPRRKYQQFVFPHSFSRELLKFSGRQTEFGWQKQLSRVAMLGTLYRRGSVHFIEVELFNSTLFHRLFPCSL
jgi:hypothetical protein